VVHWQPRSPSPKSHVLEIETRMDRPKSFVRVVGGVAGRTASAPHPPRATRSQPESIIDFPKQHPFSPQKHVFPRFNRIEPALLDGYSSTLQGLLDWFEVDLGFPKLFVH